MKKTVLAFATALVLTACAPHTSGIMGSSTGEVRVDNRSFGSEVTVEQVQSRQQGDLLQGAGIIQSKVATDLRLQYKFTWYDASGFTLEDEGNTWKSLKLHGKQRMQVTALAPNANAVRYELYVRKAFSN